MSSYLDVKELAELVRHKRGDRGLREIASTTGISASTISRVENEKTLDVQTFLTLCDWLEVSPHQLIKSTKNISKLSNAESLCIKVRSDPRLKPEIANVLAVLIQAAYSL